jgi:hypothetical protein
VDRALAMTLPESPVGAHLGVIGVRRTIGLRDCNYCSGVSRRAMRTSST